MLPDRGTNKLCRSVPSRTSVAVFVDEYVNVNVTQCFDNLQIFTNCSFPLSLSHSFGKQSFRFVMYPEIRAKIEPPEDLTSK